MRMFLRERSWYNMRGKKAPRTAKTKVISACIEKIDWEGMKKALLDESSNMEEEEYIPWTGEPNF